MNIPYIWNASRKPGMYVDLTSYLLEQRTIFIGPEITSEMASIVSMQMLALSQDKLPISLYINCYGGTIPAGLAIVDMMNFVDQHVPVHTYCIGECVGVATVILASGRAGKRRAFPSARISLFQEWYGVESLWGAQSQDKGERDRLMKIVQDTLQRHTQLSAEFNETSLGNLFRTLEFFDAATARKCKIIDEICGIGDNHTVRPNGPEENNSDRPMGDQAHEPEL